MKARVLLRAASVVLGCSVLFGCGGGAGGPPNPFDNHSDSKGTLSVSPKSLTFTATGPDGPTPPPQTVTGTVAGFSGSTLYIPIVGSGAAIGSISNVFLTSPTTGQAQVSVPSPASLEIGTHKGVVTVRACTSNIDCSSGNLSGSPQTIDVTYVVPGIRPSSDSINYQLENTTQKSDYARQITITATPVQTWTAAVDQAWLTVSPNGTSGSAMQTSLVDDAVTSMRNGVYTAHVTVTPSSSGNPLSIPVTLTIRRTQVSYVSPHVLTQGQRAM